MKKYRKLLLTSFAVYIVLLILLVAAEGGRPDASIQSFWDAIWFSIITLTTVGYGDLSPVTPFGRVVGLIFAFCSVGILASLIGIGLNLLSGTIIPRFRLRFARRQLWYAFSEENEDTAALAEALARQDRNCLLIFPRDNAILSGPNIVRMVFDPDSLARIRRSKDGLSLVAEDLTGGGLYRRGDPSVLFCPVRTPAAAQLLLAQPGLAAARIGAELRSLMAAALRAVERVGPRGHRLGLEGLKLEVCGHLGRRHPEDVVLQRQREDLLPGQQTQLRR